MEAVAWGANYTVWTYGFYLALSVIATVWVARTLARNGRVFLVDTFGGDTKMADSVNHLLVVGFYLINIGYICVALKEGVKPISIAECMELIATKVGWVLLILGGMHFFNLFIFSSMRRRAIQTRRVGAAVHYPTEAPLPPQR